ncbi:hypothetical protein K440DRAFT_662383 [Wilcoxina mikolae CBS 423.85]|nr:hypothetical protein K440DRAFT_662383 [Wilcoxina mikolae CBS 423.85]
MWILQKPNLEEFQYDETRFVDLERPTAQEQIVSHQNLTASSDESIRRYITAQISSLQVFLADSNVSPSEVNRRRLGDSVETVRKSITANSSQTTPQPPLPPRSFFSTSPQPIISSSQFIPPARSHITPLTQSSRAHTFPRTAQSPPTSSAVQLRTQTTWPHPNLRPPVTEAPQREHKRTPSGRLEPVQEMHLDGPTQRTYFEYMQECCIDAAHTFYMRHQERLDVVTDRKGRRLCYTTHGRPISNKHDLTLPQWTHLLRRLSDAKGLKREMVSRIESFNGEIQPVDEVRHACSKNKEKSDRDLLALVQITRCFCWQLRDWEKCEQLDDLYGTIEEAIDIARRERQERRELAAATAEGGRKEVRAVNTWPFESI